MTGVIYARYSSDNQREESIDGQLRECTEYANKNGITIVKTYIDRAISATTDKRPDFQNMINESKNSIFDVVLVWKLDRFSRNRYDAAKYKYILKKNGVKIISATENIPDDPTGIILESMLEGINEYYSAELSVKVKRGQTENALKCVYNGGGIPYGFLIDNDRHFQPDPLKANIILDIFKQYDNGKTIKEIVDYLDCKNIYYNKEKKFNINNISYILKNKRYLGIYLYKDVTVENAFTPIVDKELFERVQTKMKKNAKAPARHKAEDDYILTTKLHCGKCGKFMVGESGTSRTGVVHHYYKCVNTKKVKLCDKKNVRKELIEDNVIKHTLDLLNDEKLLENVADKMVAYLNKGNNNLKLLNNQLKDVNKKIDNILDAIENGAFSKSTNERLKTLETSKDRLEESIEIEKANNIPITKEQILYWFNTFKDLDMTVLLNRQFIVNTFINSIYLYDDKLTIIYNIENKTEDLSLKDIENSSDMENNTAPSLNNPKHFLLWKTFRIFFCY